MNKNELLDAIVAQVDDVTKTKTAEILEALMVAIQEALSNEDTVTLVGFGAFSTSKRAARVGRNPRTGEELKIEAKIVPKFTAGKGLKEAVNAKKKKSKK
jgi:DNA-binding protein HU-beta